MTDTRERGKHEHPRRRLRDRVAAGNPSQQTAPYGQPVTNQDGWYDGEPSAQATIQEMRADQEAQADQDNVGGHYPGNNPTVESDYTYRRASQEYVLASGQRIRVQADGQGITTGELIDVFSRMGGAAPLTGFGKITTCPDCRGEGGCSGCYKDTGNTASVKCGYCGGTKVCPSCRDSKYVRIAPAEAPKVAATDSEVQPEVTARVFASTPQDSVGARAMITSDLGSIIGKVAGFDGDRMLVRWRDERSTWERTTDFDFQGR